MSGNKNELSCPYCERDQAQAQLGVGDYLGVVDRAVQSSQCHASMLRHDGARVLPTHAHDWPFICTLLSGSYVSRTRATEMEFTHNIAVYHPRDFEHQDEIGNGGGTFFGVQLNPALVEGAQGSRCADDILPIGDAAVHVTLGEIYCAMAKNEDALVLDALAAELAGLLFGESLPTAGGAPRWLSQVYEQLREEDGATLADLSANVGVHTTTLTRLYRAHLGRSIGDTKARIRDARAFFAVVGTDDALSDIGLASGFADQSHMTRAFKQRFAITPGRLRTQHRAIA